jgi:hypothetical protein
VLYEGTAKGHQVRSNSWQQLVVAYQCLDTAETHGLLTALLQASSSACVQPTNNVAGCLETSANHAAAAPQRMIKHCAAVGPGSIS